MKFQVEADVEYLIGRLCYGHYSTTIEANSQEEVEKMLENKESCEKIINNMELIIDDYEIDDIGPIEFPLIITPLYE